jgi:hypothetical protein
VRNRASSAGKIRRKIPGALKRIRGIIQPERERFRGLVAPRPADNACCAGPTLERLIIPYAIIVDYVLHAALASRE